MRDTKRVALFLALLTILCGVPLAQAQVLLPQSSSVGTIIGGSIPCPNEAPFIKVTDGIAACAADPGAGAGAPTTSTYLTQTPDGTLSAEQALSLLASGLMINTTTTGVVTIYAGAACTNQVIEDLSASGAPNCVSITNAYIADGTIQAAKLAFTPIQSGTTAGGDLTGTYPNPTVAPNSIALATDTTGRYVGKITAGTNITLANCTEGENVDCTVNATDTNTDDQTATEVPLTPFSTIAATNVQAGLEEIVAEFVDTDDQTATEVPSTPFATIAATNVQAALEEIFNEASAGLDDQIAAEVPFTPVGTIAGTDTQTAVAEVATDAAAALSTHEADTTAIHGIANTANLILEGDARLTDSRTPVLPTTTTLGGVFEEGCASTDKVRAIGADGHIVCAADQEGVPGTGITSLNGLDATDQSLAVSPTGSDVGWSSVTSTHTLLVPNAGATARGVISTGAQTIAGAKTFSSPIVGSLTGNAGTATALAANGANCGAGEAAAGVDASGAAEGCFTPSTTDDQTAAEVAFTPNGTIAATDTQAAIQEVRDEAILLTSKDAASGVAGLTTNTKLKIAQLGSYHAHTALSAGSQITPEQLFVGIEGSGAPVTLTNVQPITGGVANQIAVLVGIGETVTFVPQTNFILCGDEPSVTVGPGLQSPMVKKDPTGTIWRRLDCGSFPFINREIVADENSKVCIGDIANGNKQCFFEEAGVSKHESYTGDVLDTITNFTAIATTGDVTVGGALHGLVQKASLGLIAPTTAESGFIQMEWPAEVTLQEIQCSTNIGTVTINIEERARATPDTAGVEALTADLVCDSDGAVSTTFTDAVQAANVPIALQIAAVASSPGVVRVHVKAVRN